MSAANIDLVILRHGEAGHASSDKTRPLTDYGQQQIHAQFQWLKNQNFVADLILHSPYQRTTETAQISSVYFPDAEMKVEPLITPDGDPTMVASLLTALAQQSILIASHMPVVSYLTAEFLPDRAMFAYPVAGLCWLQIETESMKAILLHKHWPETIS